MTSAAGLGERWRDAAGAERADEVVARLLAGRPLDGLGLDTIDGRVDLRGLPAPIPTRLKRYELEGWFVEELGNQVRFTGQELRGLDLSGASLDGFRFFGSSIVDCRFDGARCQDWRMWTTTVEDVSFTATDLRRSALGGWNEGAGNQFRNVSFARADLTKLACPAATFIDCDFAKAKLVGIDFQSSGFTRCHFAGPMKQVIFWDHGFNTGKPDPNPMEDVDFTDATFKEVEFRRLELERVRLPTAPGHVVLENYACVLERTLAALQEDPDPDAVSLSAFFAVSAKWALPGQRVGVFSLADFAPFADPARVEQLLRRSEHDCRT